jgi:catechol 2,3-dioxygenase-like lactoylglutathione lyase family enzyme
MASPRAILPVLAIASSLTLVWRASPNGQGTAAIPQPEGPVIAGLDHVPIAVTDLDAASAHYRALGFALKPGRPHANGIRNQHAKFPDGTELELITAPAATDALTTTYRRHLAQGDGPAFLALFAPDPNPVARRLDAARIAYRRSPAFIQGLAAPLDYIFMGPRNRSPTDRPEHFAHANTAESLVGVWLAGSDFARERLLLTTLGATLTQRRVNVPDPVAASVARLSEGEVVLVPASHQRVRDRRIVGVTLRVRSLAAAAQVLARGPGRPRHQASDAGSSSLFIPPEVAHGLWLELREVKR